MFKSSENLEDCTDIIIYTALLVKSFLIDIKKYETDKQIVLNTGVAEWIKKDMMSTKSSGSLEEIP